MFCFLFQLQSFGDWEGVVSEVDEATRAVHQLGTLLFEMEILRTYLEQADLQLFDSILEPAKTTAFIAVHGLVGNFLPLSFEIGKSTAATPKTVLI